MLQIEILGFMSGKYLPMVMIFFQSTIPPSAYEVESLNNENRRKNISPNQYILFK